MTNHLSFVECILIAAAFALVVFFSSYRLFESPETWMDEGLIIQSAQGLLETGKVSLPVAPGVYEPLGYISTGAPITLPLAGVFAVFGVSIEAARLVMLAFLLSFYIALWFYARKALGTTSAWLAFFLLVFFAPIYGNGRNVLGEVPGLLFILLALIPLLGVGALTRNKALLVGMCAGLAVAAKPIFILFLPALLLALLLRHRELKLKKSFLFGVAGVLAPLLVWAFFQFDHMPLANLFAVYANPHDLNIGSAIAANVKRLFFELQPLYFLLALALWALSYGLRRLKHETVSLTEEALLFFSILILLAYMRTAGYYRYFFPGQVFALLYLPQSLWYLLGRRSRLLSQAVIVGICALIVFQAYETTTRSWVAVHYNSTRTETLERYFASLPVGEEIFVYQAPEVMTFTGEHPVYQYVEITPSIRIGEEYKYLVLSGTVQKILTPEDFFNAHHDTLFMRYAVVGRVDSYVVAARQIR